MTKSQNTKNEQQKDLCITIEQLTEQWKKGELPCGWYWVESSIAEGIYAYTAEYLNNMYRPRNGEKVLAPVPSYDEWQALLSDQLAKKEGEEIVAELEAENQQLKELLKECFEYIDWTDGTGSPISQQKLLDKIDEVLK